MMLLAGLLLVLSSGVGAGHAAPPLDVSLAGVTLTVSGTIRGPNGPAAGVFVGVNTLQDWQQTTTDWNGYYQVTVRTEGKVFLNVRPQESTRLCQISLYLEGKSASFTQDFTLSPGHLLSIALTGNGAAIRPNGMAFDIRPLIASLPANKGYLFWWNEAAGREEAVLPPDMYNVTVTNVPQGYYPTAAVFDLRSSDQLKDMPLNTTVVNPIPYDPPDASKITIGPPDDLGEAAVTGAPGAALPAAVVFLVNLNSSHQAYTMSRPDGSFSSRIYAPPGSAIMIKHGPPGPRWYALDVGVAEGLNPFPGTIVQVPNQPAADPWTASFAAAGAVDGYQDDGDTTRNYVASAWAMTGTVAPPPGTGSWTRILTATYKGQIDPGFYLGGQSWTHPTLGDLDGDSDLDLLVGDSSGTITLYRNAGSVVSPNWTYAQSDYAEIARIGSGGWAAPVLGDISGDGIPDLVVGTGSGNLLIFYNRGTHTVAAWPSLPDEILSVGRNAAPTLADLDNDGRLELIVGQADGTLAFFHSEATSTYPSSPSMKVY